MEVVQSPDLSQSSSIRQISTVAIDQAWCQCIGASAVAIEFGLVDNNGNYRSNLSDEWSFSWS